MSTTGDLAPDFTLKDQHGADVTLSSFRGHRNVVIVFYPFAFSGVCSGELAEIRDRIGELRNETTEVLAISCDPMFSLRSFADQEAYEFPLLSDFWPHGDVARAYGSFVDELGCAGRSTYVIDRDGLVQWQVTHELGEARNIDDYVAALAALEA